VTDCVRSIYLPIVPFGRSRPHTHTHTHTHSRCHLPDCGTGCWITPIRHRGVLSLIPVGRRYWLSWLCELRQTLRWWQGRGSQRRQWSPNFYGTVPYASSVKLRQQLYCEPANIFLRDDSASKCMWCAHALTACVGNNNALPSQQYAHRWLRGYSKR